MVDSDGVSANGLDQPELAAWVRLATVLELLPGVLDAQLRRDAGLMHFEYFVLAMLSEAPKRTLRMSELAAQTNSTPTPAAQSVPAIAAQEANGPRVRSQVADVRQAGDGQRR